MTTATGRAGEKKPLAGLDLCPLPGYKRQNPAQAGFYRRTRVWILWVRKWCAKLSRRHTSETDSTQFRNQVKRWSTPEKPKHAAGAYACVLTTAGKLLTTCPLRCSEARPVRALKCAKDGYRTKAREEVVIGAQVPIAVVTRVRGALDSAHHICSVTDA